MPTRIAIVGAGVSGLTCGVTFAERGFQTSILAHKAGQQTTSAAAAAIWFPYDAQPLEKVIPWALETFEVLVELTRDSRSGVSMVEVRQFSHRSEIKIPDWAIPLGASAAATGLTPVFKSGYALRVPIMDTTIYLDYLAKRFVMAGGSIVANTRLERLEQIDAKFDLLINCAGIGARELVGDRDLEPHRGQVAIVPRLESLSCAVVCDDAPLMYAIPRGNDCVFGGTNDISDDVEADPATTKSIVAECSRVLKINEPNVLAERVGLRPFRKSGVRLERDQTGDGRTVIHNYGHGGSGFTLSWACAREALSLATV
jgi:D-amino-acid oxidase